ncbi:hypothetical protein HAX54_041994 [Datura stramonium]|uniref:Uncharacterized protein n=1 Tax=Datura stramonium TaxID=4076 RepID=A0ABS8Y6A7_DATST|nr:hypothetical protein [Datura stramonium]
MGYKLGIRRNRENNRIKSIQSNCLLLTMCEPKQFMEVSKETWVFSSTDFILPERKQAKAMKKKKKKEIPEETKIRRSIDKSQHILLQPPRSLCSFPAVGISPMSMATMIEQKLVNAVAYESFVLMR